MFKNILWKEWREQRWKLAFGTVMLLFFAGSFLAARVTSQRESMLLLCAVGCILLTIYSAMGIFAPEQTNRTKNFLAAKPVQPWKVFLGKWFLGWLNFSLPLLLCSGGMIWVGSSDPTMPEPVFRKILIAPACMVAFATMFYSLICGLAPRKTGEAGVGLTGVLVLIGIILYETLVSTPKFTNPLQYLGPFQFLGFLDPGPIKPNLPWYLLVQSGLLAAMMVLSYRKWKRSA